MAKMQIENPEALELMSRLDTAMRRTGIRRIVEAGGKVAVEDMTQSVAQSHHVRTGEMKQAVGMAEYRESFDGGQVNVYPQGTDRRGVRNAMKAFVINYGIGARPYTVRSRKKREANKTGDKFITGKFKDTTQKVQQAMAAEASAVLSEVTKGG